MPDIEYEYLDVLQNIEFAIVTVYRQNPNLTDYEVDNALNALIRVYRFEQQNRVFGLPKMSSQVEKVYHGVRQMCEWRLGREKFSGSTRKSKEPSPTPITIDEIIACLKRIRKSVDLWNKQGGRRGYLQYIERFVV